MASDLERTSKELEFERAKKTTSTRAAAEHTSYNAQLAREVTAECKETLRKLMAAFTADKRPVVVTDFLHIQAAGVGKETDMFDIAASIVVETATLVAQCMGMNVPTVLACCS